MSAAPTKHILVRLDANHQIGLGHAVRVSSLLDALKTPHTVTVAGVGKQLADFFPGARLVEPFPAGAPALVALIQHEHPDVVLVDHPDLEADFWAVLGSDVKDAKIVAIDDFGGAVDADLIINGTVLEAYHRYPQARATARILSGAQYALVRKPFANSRWHDPADRSLLVIVGGGDRARDWAFRLVSDHLDLSTWGRVTMIVGRAFPELRKLEQCCAALEVTLHCGISAEEMARTMAQSCVALITGGMVVYEASIVGVPAVVFPQVENMIAEVKWFADQGCVVDLGYDGGMRNELIYDAVNRLMLSDAGRKSMSAAQQAHFDGLGMLRAAEQIDAMLQ